MSFKFFKEFEAQNEDVEKDIVVRYKNDELTFSKKHSLFGEKVVIFYPPHGNMNCICSDCELYQMNSDYSKRGYTCIAIEQKTLK